MSPTIAFILGTFVGIHLGVLVMCLLRMWKEADLQYCGKAVASPPADLGPNPSHKPAIGFMLTRDRHSPALCEKNELELGIWRFPLNE